MSNRSIVPAGVAPPFGRYSHAVEAAPGQRWLYVSGQVGVTPEGALAAGIEAQCEQSFANLARIVAAADMTLDDIVKVGVYLTSAGDVAAYRTVRDRFLGDRRPASTLLVVQALAHADWLVEIELTASRA